MTKATDFPAQSPKTRAPGQSCRPKTLQELLANPQEIPRISSLVLHRALADSEATEAAIVVASATPDQVRDLVDLRVWRRDRSAGIQLDRGEVLKWIHGIATLPDEIAIRHFDALDIELISYLLCSRMHIYPGSAAEAPDEAQGTFYATPDGSFVLDIVESSETETDQLIEIIQTLYRHDLANIRSLLTNLTRELPTELEEWCLRWRKGRLQDLGFADPEEALAVYVYVDPKSGHGALRTEPADPALPGPHHRSDPAPDVPIFAPVEQIIPADTGSFWSRALDRIRSPEEREALAEALTYLANMTLSADGIDPANLEGAELSLVYLRGRLSLGLESLSGGDLDQIETLLRQYPLLRISQIGNSLVLGEHRRLVRDLRSGSFGRESMRFDLLDRQMEEALAALLSRPPRWIDDRGRSQPFSSLADLARAEHTVDTVILSAALAPKVTRPDPLPSGVTLSGLFLTDVYNKVADRSGALRRHELADLHERLSQPESQTTFRLAGKVLARERASSMADSPKFVAKSESLAESWVTQLVEEIEPIREQSIDPRFVSRLHVTR